MADQSLRELLIRVLDWRDAHVHFDSAVEGIPPRLRGIQPEGLPYSAWQLVEHMRITQRDILDFCRSSSYREPRWPEDYWPVGAQPESERVWEASIAGFREDREALEAMAADPDIDLFALIPGGTGQTYIRELLLVADHNAYHLGQLVLVRRLLGIWRGD